MNREYVLKCNCLVSFFNLQLFAHLCNVQCATGACPRSPAPSTAKAAEDPKIWEGGGGHCFDWGFMRTFPGNQDVAMK